MLDILVALLVIILIGAIVEGVMRVAGVGYPIRNIVYIILLILLLIWILGGITPLRLGRF